MLKAFKKQLQTMSRDPSDEFTARIRRLAGVREAVFFEKPLRQMILAMPDMIASMRSWTEDSRTPSALQRAHRFLLAYLYNPTDFLPDQADGLFGYIDDAYVVARFYECTMVETEWAGLRPYTEHPMWAHDVPVWVEYTRRLLPEVTAKIDQMVEQLLEREERNYASRKNHKNLQVLRG